MTVIIIPKGGYGPLHKVQKKEKKQQRPAVLFRNYKINTCLVRNILDNSLNVWMVYLPACWGYFDSTLYFHREVKYYVLLLLCIVVSISGNNITHVYRRNASCIWRII